MTREMHHLLPRRRAIGLGLAGLTAATAEADAAVLFADSFASGASPAWGNERGQWRTANRQYDATFPNNNPVNFTSVTTLPKLKNFTVKVKVHDFNDGGIWLHSGFNGGNINGILLVTGGQIGSFNGMYWHVAQNGAFSGMLNPGAVAGIQGTTVSLVVHVRNNTYSVFLAGSATPVTTLTDTTFATGSAGLYDFSPTSGGSSPRGETFGPFSILG